MPHPRSETGRLRQNGYHYDIALALRYASSEVGDRTLTSRRQRRLAQMVEIRPTRRPPIQPFRDLRRRRLRKLGGFSISSAELIPPPRLRIESKTNHAYKPRRKGALHGCVNQELKFGNVKSSNGCIQLTARSPRFVRLRPALCPFRPHGRR